MYTHNANIDGTCEIVLDGAVVDTVGPWETQSEADAWGRAVVDKYNSAEYAGVDYPNEIKEGN